MAKRMGIILLVNLMGFIMVGNIHSQSEVTKEEIKGVVLKVCTLLKEHYVYPELAATICDRLQIGLKSGRYDSIAGWDVLTKRLNEDFRGVTNDQHLESRVTGRSFKPDRDMSDIIFSSFGFISRNKATNFGIPKVELLEGNIGYIELTSFKPVPNPESERIVRSAMDFLSNCDALIIDLRNNGGGHTNMREFISSYFFSEPTQLSSTYSRETTSLYESFTLKDFYSQRLVDVPLYILMSEDTISAPEIFAYDLQAMKRAIIVGEVSAGSVNSGRFFTVGNSIDLLIATGYTVNPITKTNCEGEGVHPDVKVSSENALEKALELAKGAAEEYRKKKKSRVDGYAQEFRSQLEAVEETIAKDAIHAEEMLSKTIERFYGFEYMTPYLLLDLGDWYLKKGQVDIAIMILRQGPCYYSGLMEMHIFYKYLAEAYLKTDKKKNAVRYFLKYLELCPDDSRVLKKLSEMLERRKQ